MARHPTRGDLNISRDFLRKIPKTDLHVHLDGSLRIYTLIDLAKEYKVRLPSYTEEGLRKLVFTGNYKNLSEYLKGFQYTTQVLQTREALERAAYELAMDEFGDGVRYLEVRFAPQLHINEKLSFEDIMIAVNNGLNRAKRAINSLPQIRNGAEPPFEYGIIGCAMRKFSEDFSDYYRQFIKVHKFLDDEERFALASMELVRGLVRVRDEYGIPVVGFDLAGEEYGYPAEDHREAFIYAHKNFMKKTVHAGEAFGAESIFQAITDLYADRIGHGTHLFDADMVDLPTRKERVRYVEELAQYIADRRITIEVCLTSNTETDPNLRDVTKHPCRKMLEKNLSVTFCTDNMLISNTTVSRELEIAVNTFGLDLKRLKDIIVYGFKRSFFPQKYTEKRKYVRSVINFYESLESSVSLPTK